MSYNANDFWQSRVASTLVAVTKIVVQPEIGNSTKAVASPAAYGREDRCVVCDAPLGKQEILRLSVGQLLSCGSCRSWIYLPRPTEQEQDALHDTAEYFDHPYFQARREDQSLTFKRCREIFSVIAEIADLNTLRQKPLLDVGCDTGSFLLAAAECYRVVPFGVDISSRAVRLARERGLQVVQGTIGNTPAEWGNFTIVTAIDVLEHTVDPATFLIQLHRRISPGGLLYLQVPNLESLIYQMGRHVLDATRYRPRRTAERLFPLQHVQYFSRTGLRLIAQRSGFEMLRLQTRVLPADDIVASPPARAILRLMQEVDSWRGKQILLRAVLRKPM